MCWRMFAGSKRDWQGRQRQREKRCMTAAGGQKLECVRLLAVWRIDLALSGSRGQSVEEVGNGYLLYVQGTGHGTGMSMVRVAVSDSGKGEVRLVVCVQEEEMSSSDLSASKSRVKRGVLSCGTNQARC